METLLQLVPASLLDRVSLPDYAFVARLNLALALLIGSESRSIYLGSAVFKILASLSFFFGGLGKALKKPLSKDVDSVWPLLREFSKGELWTENRYAFWIVIGLGCSVVGDLLLIPSREDYFGDARQDAPALQEPIESQASAKRKGMKQPQGATPSTPHAPAEVKAEGDTVYFKAGTFFFALAQIAYTAAFFSAPAATSSPWNWAYFGLAAIFGLGSSWSIGVFGGGLFGDLLNIPQDTKPLVKLYVFIITTMVGVASATDSGWQRIIGAVTFMVSDLFVAVDVFGRKRNLDTKKSTKQAHMRGREGWMFRAVGWILYFWAQMLLAGSV